MWGGDRGLDSDYFPSPCSLRRDGYTVQVNVNDYLDIYCPHYNSSGSGPGAGPGPGGGAEQYVLYMVSRSGYRTCNASQGFKRWECNRPHAPHSPIKFSEKFQRYSAFSLGYEFHAGHEYYYISTPTHNLHWKCLKMKVFVCCASTSHSGEKPIPTLPQFTMGPNVKINVLGESAQRPLVATAGSAAPPSPVPSLPAHLCMRPSLPAPPPEGLAPLPPHHPWVGLSLALLLPRCRVPLLSPRPRPHPCVYPQRTLREKTPRCPSWRRASVGRAQSGNTCPWLWPSPFSS
uniref:Ephrin-A3 n=1 Tax=Sarcophilus harrisii TaxID=9305 RepID=A0A7N4PIS5_SARHA